MKKLFLSLAVVFGTACTALAQGQFYSVNPDKVVSMVTQLTKLPHDNALMILDQALQAMASDGKSYRKGFEIISQRLGDPTDSIHNEEMYIAVLKHATKSYVLSSSEKARPQALLEIAMKNRPGQAAADIDYVTIKGKQDNLLNNDNKLTLVFFNDPDCESCALVKENLAASAAVKQAVDAGSMRVVAINPMNNEKLWKKTSMPEWVENGWNKSQSVNEGGSYDLPTMPLFYLLAGDNTVLVKNEASLKRIEKALAVIAANPTADSATLATLLFAN